MKKLIILLNIVCMSSAFAVQPVYNINQPAPTPKSLTVDGQIYDGSVSGLRSYIDNEVADSKPKLYRKLDRKLSKLESDYKVSMYGGLGLMLSSLVIMVTGFGGNCDAFASNYDACVADEDEKSQMHLTAGFGVLAVGGILFYAFRPTRKDMFELINYHNKRNKKHMIKWQIGYNPVQKYPLLSLNYSF